MAPSRREYRVILKRRLNGWQIFFIAIGGVIGIGFFRGSSESLAIAGPVGALIAVTVVGVVATSVMEGICEMIIRWPIPNAMVEFVKSFVDEDLGVAIGVMYWYTYCVTFSALIIAAGNLTAYWNLNWIYQALLYAFTPLVLLTINALPVNVFGWIELFGGIAKVCLVLGTIGVMCAINAGAGPGADIGSKYFETGIQNNPHVAANHFIAVSEAIPLATFAYIGVELLTTTAFEARDPDELKLPARNIGWFSTVLYVFATGTFVANTSWKDQNLPQLFQQALVTITKPPPADIAAFDPAAYPETHAAPLIALLRSGLGSRFLPGFLNACFIYSALSCANTALFVASRQLYGLTQSITVEHDSNVFRRLLAWPGRVDSRTQSPWPALVVSVAFLYWLPFIKLRAVDNEKEVFLQDVQAALINLGSVSCILMWFFQCVAYLSFSRCRRLHSPELESDEEFENIYDRSSSGWFEGLQPGLAWLGAVCTLIIIFFFNTAAMWNGQRLGIKTTSTFLSPGIVVLLWLIKKYTRPSSQRRWFVNFRNSEDFMNELRRLNSLIYPTQIVSRRQGPYKMLRHHIKQAGNSDVPEQADSSGIGTDSRPSSLGVAPPKAYNRGDLRNSPIEPAMQPNPAPAEVNEPLLPGPDGRLDRASRANSDISATGSLSPGGYGRTHLRAP